MKRSFTSLIAPAPAAKFLRERWPHREAVFCGENPARRELLHYPPLQSVDALLAFWPWKVLATSPPSDGETRSVELEAGEARSAYDERKDLTFIGAEEVPLDGAWQPIESREYLVRLAASRRRQRSARRIVPWHDPPGRSDAEGPHGKRKAAR